MLTRRLLMWSALLRRGAALRGGGVPRAARPQQRAVAAQAAPVADVAAPVVFDIEKAVLPGNDDENVLRLRHSSAHVMAMAVQRLFSNAQVTVGPWIESGFYYDFYKAGEQFTPVDLKAIKKEMDSIIKKNYPIVREEVTRDEARRRIEAIGERFKLEILDGIKDDTITIYSIGDEWWDLCAGPHVESTGKLNAKAVALQSVAGAYWRGDEKRESLSRIYGTAFPEAWQLKEHGRRLEEAKKRDHRVLGKKLDLFSIQEAAGGGLVFWHPKGARIRRLIEDTWKEEHAADGYELLYTPHVANVNLWKTSGHYDFYAESMFDQMKVEEDEYQLKPMNCPFHCLVFKDGLRSYRELPLRWAELGTVYRYERSGTLHGLMRVRGFTQDDAHIFCTPDQLEDEIVGVLELTEKILTKFGFAEYQIMLSTRPEKSVGSDEIWDKATEALRGALDRKGWAYTVNEGDGAFYGPKIDLKIRDALGRSWQCSTVQCDFNLPERFDLTYAASDGTRSARPIMVHRAIFGSLERFFAILLESCGGELPLWLAPTQMVLLPVTDTARDYALAVQKRAVRRGLRVDVDSGRDRLPKQIRNYEQQRVPIMAVVGDKETESGELAVRIRGRGDCGTIDADALLDMLALVTETGELGPFANAPIAVEAATTADVDDA
ncbi:hypothetical protein M885DRAFT_518845 [Pelagophyceae sp. CCMP2097]|nr:hypothetical protein M885DRAFT_518845 [Pelagophyceae sp. CCMP2097]